MNLEEALLILDTALEQRVLNDVQELVFRNSWLGQTYVEIAQSSGYNANYIKDVGYKLWKLLSKVFKEEVTKSNFRSVLRRGHIAFKNTSQTLKGQTLLTRSVFEESLNVYPNSVSVGEEISSSKDVADKSQIDSPQILSVNTALAAHLNAENSDLNSRNIKTDSLTLIPQFVIAETTAKTLQGLGEVVDVLAFYGCTEKLNLLKQSIMDGHCRLVADRFKRSLVISSSVRSTLIQRG